MERQSAAGLGAMVAAVAAVTGICTSILTSYYIRKKSNNANKDTTQSSSSNVLQVIQQRRSIFPKQYTGRPVSSIVINEMLEAARWAPSHHLTEPWEFVVLESLESRTDFGNFLAKSYKDSCAKSNKAFSQAKYDKKLKNATMKTSHVICICVRIDNKTNPIVEEICSVAMAVQNMFLVATAHGVGAYWSSGGVYQQDKQQSPQIENPIRLKEFLNWPDNNNKERICLGWVFVGDFHGDDGGPTKSWPTGRRKTLDDRLSWR